MPYDLRHYHCLLIESYHSGTSDSVGLKIRFSSKINGGKHKSRAIT